MRSYSSGLAAATRWTKTQSGSSQDQADLAGYANDIYKKICSAKSWPFLEGQAVALTIASTQFVQLPNTIWQNKVKEISVVPVGSNIRYTPKLSPSQEHWDQLNLTTFVSDIPEWYYVFAGQIGLWPTPASSNSTITITGGLRPIDLSIADYTTGQIVSVANGGTAVVGTGTSWTANMANLLSLSITNGTAANSGDGNWYPVASVGSSTSLTLLNPYTGLSISSATTNYILGQLPLLPEAFQDMPWKWAAAQYWIKEEDERAKPFADLYNTDLVMLVQQFSSATDAGYVIDNGQDQQILNPNLVIHLG